MPVCSGEVLLRLLLLILEDGSQPGLWPLPSLPWWLLVAAAGVVADPQVSLGLNYTLLPKQIHRHLSPPLHPAYPPPHPPPHPEIQSPPHPPEQSPPY